MLLPSIWIGLAGTAFTAVLLAADWYIWDPSYRNSYGFDLSRRGVTGGARKIQQPGGDFGAARAPLVRAPGQSLTQVQSGRSEHCTRRGSDRNATPDALAANG